MKHVSNRFTVILDASVLYPFTIRDVLLRFAEAGLYRVRWSEDIMKEWTSALSLKRPELKAKITRTRERMDAAFEEANVTDYQDLVLALELPDPDDRHVLAAAIRCGAELIVTENLKDFPAATLKHYDIEPVDADDFATGCFDLSQPTACGALRQMRTSYRNPAMNVSEFLMALQRNGVPKLASLAREHIESI